GRRLHPRNPGMSGGAGPRARRGSGAVRRRAQDQHADHAGVCHAGGHAGRNRHRAARPELSRRYRRQLDPRRAIPGPRPALAGRCGAGSHDRRRSLYVPGSTGASIRAGRAMTDQMPKKLFIKTYGCQMNVYDSQRMAEPMAAEGYVQTDRAEDADMGLVNTCHIREKAAEKLYSDLGRLKPLKGGRPDLKIGVAGCVAQAEGGEIIRRAPQVDLVVGPQSYHNLPAMVRGEAPAVNTEFPPED